MGRILPDTELLRRLPARGGGADADAGPGDGGGVGGEKVCGGEEDGVGGAECWNLVLMGGPDVNSAAAALRARIPAIFLERSDGRAAFGVGECVWEGPGHGLVSLGPWGPGGLLAVVAGQGAAGLNRAVELLSDGLFQARPPLIHWG